MISRPRYRKSVAPPDSAASSEGYAIVLCACRFNAKLNPDKKLLPPVNFGSWEITHEGEKSILTYRICTDPGGDIPHWIVAQANQRYLPQMLEDIEAFAGSKFPHAP